MIWHIFAKDWKLLWPAVLGAGLANITQRLMLSRADSLAAPNLLALNLFGFLALVATTVLIVVVGHQDPLPVLCDDWLVRPISRRDLLASKLLFVALVLTPVVLTTVRRLRAPVRPHAYATAHLANAASLLLPVSNLTNLLAFHVANVSFTKFALVMTLPWLAAVATVYLVFRVFFRRDLSVQPDPPENEPAPQTPVFALLVVALTLAGFVIAEAAGVAPAWAALAGAAVMAVRSLARRHTTAVAIVRAVNVPFLVFVLALGVVVQAVMRNGVADRMGAVLPSGSGLLALLGFAVVAAVLANIVNNLPATLVLVPLVASSGPAAVLAVLIGVNIGPNLTYVGSLSNLLWRSVLRRYGVSASVGEYTRLGLCTVPTALVAAVLAL